MVFGYSHHSNFAVHESYAYIYTNHGFLNISNEVIFNNSEQALCLLFSHAIY